MIPQLFACTLVLTGISKGIHSYSRTSSNNVYPFAGSLEGLLPGESANPDYIIYPTNPGNPGNYSNQLNMFNYFSNLFDYFPSNKDGDCAFVSLIQVLTYYDTFYNDLIIPEQYEAKASLSSSNVNASSPGVLKDSVQTPRSSFTDLYSFVNATYNECYDSKLLRDYNEALGRNNSGQFCHSINWISKAQLIDNWFSQYHLETGMVFSGPDANYSNYTFSTDPIYARMIDEWDANEFLEEAMIESYPLIEGAAEFIDNGIPVLLSICQGFSQTDNNGHAQYDNIGNHSVVAYDYEIVDDKIVLYCNFGYENDSMHLPYNDGDFKIVFAYVPVYYNSSVFHHSDNYLIDNKEFCGCGYHTHSLTYTYVNNQKHSVYCPCGYLQYENHTDPFAYSCCVEGPLINPVPH